MRAEKFAKKKKVPSFRLLVTTITRLQKKNPGPFKSLKPAGLNNGMFPIESSNHQHSSLAN